MPTDSTKDIRNNKETTNTSEEAERYFPGFLAFIDTTEQQIPRPVDKRKRKMYYSGKRKKHTVKNLYTANQKGLIIYKTKRRQRGRKHDYRVYKKYHPESPKDVEGMYDLGFLGVKKDFAEQKSCLPIKKDRGCELTEVEKEYNKNHSKKRIVI
jgi:DDE superfamily endonuclease